jgi:hypothetical protein
MKQKDREQQEQGKGRQQERTGKEPITSNSVKNAHATGDGAMRRSLDAIPDEEELEREKNDNRQQREQY